MDFIRLLLLNVVQLCIGLTCVCAQEGILPAGGNASGNIGSASYSIGQVFYITSSGTNGSVAQGVQQPYEISVITGMDEFKDMKLECYAFPNPATNM